MHDLVLAKTTAVIETLDAALRAALGPAISGVSWTSRDLHVHFFNTPAQDTVALASQIAAGHAALALTTDKTSIRADGLDTATLTCADPRVAGDSAVTYRVLLDGEEYTAPASTPVSGGQVRLTLATETAGDYLVEIARQGAFAHETGYITIRAEE